MPQVEVKFVGGEKLAVNALESRTQFFIDKAHGGDTAAGPNPLEVFLASLGGCLSVYGRRYLTRHNIPFKVFNVEMSAGFCEEPPARLTDIKAMVKTDAVLGDKIQPFLAFMHACPVHNTVSKAEHVTVSLV